MSRTLFISIACRAALIGVGCFLTWSCSASRDSRSKVAHTRAAHSEKGDEDSAPLPRYVGGMEEQFSAFLKSPGRDSYLAVRKAVLSSDRYHPYSQELFDARDLIKQGKYVAAREKILESMPNLLLSPRAHRYLAIIAKEAGDDATRKAEDFMAARCTEGILATGDGTFEHPYIVVRTTDEYDVLQCLGGELAAQNLLSQGERRFDRLRLKDGSEVWFDITDAYNRLLRRIGGATTKDVASQPVGD